MLPHAQKFNSRLFLIVNKFQNQQKKSQVNYHNSINSSLYNIKVSLCLN